MFTYYKTTSIIYKPWQVFTFQQSVAVSAGYGSDEPAVEYVGYPVTVIKFRLQEQVQSAICPPGAAAGMFSFRKDNVCACVIERVCVCMCVCGIPYVSSVLYSKQNYRFFFAYCLFECTGHKSKYNRSIRLCGFWVIVCKYIVAQSRSFKYTKNWSRVEGTEVRVTPFSYTPPSLTPSSEQRCEKS